MTPTIITDTTRLGTTRNGNPFYRVTFADGHVANTLGDGSVGYSISNRDLHNTPVNVTYDRFGRITDVEAAR